MAIINENWDNLNNWNILSGYPSIQNRKLRPETTDKISLKSKFYVDSYISIITKASRIQDLSISFFARGTSDKKFSLMFVGADHDVVLLNDGQQNVVLGKYDIRSTYSIEIYISNSKILIKAYDQDSVIVNSSYAAANTSQYDIILESSGDVYTELWPISIAHGEQSAVIEEKDSISSNAINDLIKPVAASPARGTFYSYPLTVDIQEPEFKPLGYDLRYTIDGQAPNKTSLIYAGPFQLNGPYTAGENIEVKASYINSAGNYDVTYSSTFLNGYSVSATNLSGSYQYVQQVSLSSSAYPIIHTIDGTDPTITPQSDVAQLISPTGQWRASCVGPDGSIYFGAYGGYIYKSTNGGLTWSPIAGAGTRNWATACVGLDGAIYFVAYGDYIYKSTDNGLNWSTIGWSGKWYTACCVGIDGSIYFGISSGPMYKVAAGTTTFTEITTVGSRIWSTACASSNGTVYFAAYNGYIYKSVDGNNNFTQVGAIGQWFTSAVGSDGTAYFLDYSSVLGIYRSTNNGVSWASMAGTTGKAYLSAGVGTDGTVYFGAISDNIYYLPAGGSLTILAGSGPAEWRAFCTAGDGFVYTSKNDGYIYKIGDNQYSISNGSIYYSPITVSSDTVIKAMTVTSGVGNQIEEFIYNIQPGTNTASVLTKTYSYSAYQGPVYKETNISVADGNFLVYGTAPYSSNDSSIEIALAPKDNIKIMHKAAIRSLNIWGGDKTNINNVRFTFSGGSPKIDISDMSDSYMQGLGYQYLIDYRKYPRDFYYSKISSSVIYDSSKNLSKLYKPSTNFVKILLKEGDNVIEAGVSDNSTMSPVFNIINDGKDISYIRIDKLSLVRQIEDGKIIPSHNSGSVFQSPSAVSFDIEYGSKTGYISLYNNGSRYINYTVDGSDPYRSTTHKRYNGSIPVDRHTLIRYADISHNYNIMETGSLVYYVGAEESFTNPPICRISTGYQEAGSIDPHFSLIKTSEGTIKYTTDGSAPTSASNTYVRPILIDDTSKTIKFITYSAGCICYSGKSTYSDVETYNTYGNDLCYFNIKDNTISHSGVNYDQYGGATFTEACTVSGNKAYNLLGFNDDSRGMASLYGYTVSGNMTITSKYSGVLSLYASAGNMAWSVTGWNGIKKGYVPSATPSDLLYIKNLAGYMTASVGRFNDSASAVGWTRQNYYGDPVYINDPIVSVYGSQGSYISEVSGTHMLSNSHSAMMAVSAFTYSNDPSTSGTTIYLTGNKVLLDSSANTQYSAYEVSSFPAGPSTVKVFGYEKGRLPSSGTNIKVAGDSIYSNYHTEWVYSTSKMYIKDGGVGKSETQYDGVRWYGESTEHALYENVAGEYSGYNNAVITIKLTGPGRKETIYGFNKDNRNFCISQLQTKSNTSEVISRDTVLTGVSPSGYTSMGSFNGKIMPRKFGGNELEAIRHENGPDLLVRLAKKYENGKKYVRSVTVDIAYQGYTPSGKFKYDSGWIETTEDLSWPFVKTVGSFGIFSYPEQLASIVTGEIVNISSAECDTIMDTGIRSSRLPVVSYSVSGGGLLSTASVSFSADTQVIGGSSIRYTVIGNDNSIGKSVTVPISSQHMEFSDTVVSPANLVYTVETNDYSVNLGNINIGNDTEDYIDVIDNDGTVTFSLKNQVQSLPNDSIIKIEIDGSTYQLANGKSSQAQTLFSSPVIKELSGGIHKVRLIIEHNDYGYSTHNYRVRNFIRANRYLNVMDINVSYKLNNVELICAINDKEVTASVTGYRQGDIVEYNFNGQYTSQNVHQYSTYGIHKVMARITRGTASKDMSKQVILVGQSQPSTKTVLPVRTVRIS